MIDRVLFGEKHATWDLTWCLDGENKELDEPEFQQDANELLFAPGHCFLQQSSIVAYSGGAHLKNNHMK